MLQQSNKIEGRVNKCDRKHLCVVNFLFSSLLMFIDYLGYLCSKLKSGFFLLTFNG